MEPSVPNGWGSPAWSFLHGMTLDPLAPTTAKVAQKRLLQVLRCILPCPNCRASYRIFSRGLSAVEPEDVGEFVIHIHDSVNIKLEKDAANFPAESWLNYQIVRFAEEGYASYVEDMVFFLFVLAANYVPRFTKDTELEKYYREFFTLLPVAMSHRPWGATMASFLEAYPLKDSVLCGREDLFIWVYALYQAIYKANLEQWSQESIRGTVESLRKSK